MPREDLRLRVPEKRKLSRTLGPKGRETVGARKKIG
jgi:hypothetical protein